MIRYVICLNEKEVTLCIRLNTKTIKHKNDALLNSIVFQQLNEALKKGK